MALLILKCRLLNTGQITGLRLFQFFKLSQSLPTKMDVRAGMLQIKAERAFAMHFIAAFPKTTFLYLNFRIEKFCFETIIFWGMPYGYCS
jgi:hypothetical protein